MKVRFFLFLGFYFISILSCSAVVQGCHNGSAVFTTFLGYTNFYGTNYEVYSSTGEKIIIYNNQDGQNTVPCGQIVSTGTVNQGYQCWIAPSLPPTNSSSGVSWQTKVTVSGTYIPCSIDQYTVILLILSAVVGLFYLKKHSSVTHQLL